MNKRFTKLIAALALLVFMTPSLVAWGQTKDEVVAYTLQPATGSNNNYASNCDITIDGITWNLTGNSAMIPWRIGGKSLSGVDRALYSKTAISDNISKIEVTHGAASSITVNSWTVIVASDADFTNVVSTLTPTFAANATTIINRPDGKDWSNCYYKFVYNVTVSGSSNKFLEFSQAKFYKETGTTLQDSDMSLSPTALSFDLYNDAEAKTITISTSSTGAISVSNNSYVSTAVNGVATITVTPVAVTPEAQTITVSQAADNTYNAGEATFTVSVANSTPTYTVTYKANGGTGDDVVDTYYQGEDVTVRSNTFVYTDHAFTKWNTAANGSGTDYQPAATIENIQANVELFAQWEESNEVVDVLTNSNTIGETTNNYSDWTATGTSGAEYSGNSAGGNGTIQLRSNNSNSGIVSTVSGGLVKKVVVTWHSATSNGRTLNVYGNNTAYSEASDLYGDNAGTLLGTIVMGSSTELNISGDYEYIGLRSASGAMYLEDIHITWEPDNNPAVATSVTIDASGITNTNVFEGTTAGTLSVTVKDNENNPINGATVTWTSSDENVATITANGTVTLVAAGTTTITAAYAGVENQYRPSQDTYELIVTNDDPNAPGTENNPYTVAQARAAIDAGEGVNGVYATGIVSEIVTAYNAQYGNISYNISTDGTTEADQLQAYRGKSYNGENFTSEDDIQVGDIVVVYGNLKNYNGTYEFDAGNQLVSLERPQSTEPSINIADATIEVAADGGEGNLTVQYENITEIVAEVYFCDAEGEAATYDWIEAEIDDDNNVYYVIDANEGEARTAYFKVYALDDEANDVYSNLVTVNQAVYVAPASIDLRGVTTPLVFNAGAFTSSGSGYKDYDDVTYIGSNNVQYDGWTLRQVMHSGNNMQMKASSGMVYMPTILTDNGFTITVVAETNSVNVGVGEESEVNVFTTTATSADVVISAGSKYAVISTITITPLQPSEPYTLTINGYTDDNSKTGYYLIASPVTVDPSTVEGMTSDDFDLYQYDDTQDKEWLNWKGDEELDYAGHFNLVPGTGYLYAKKATTETPSYTFNLTGTPYDGNGEINIISGWNLVGNPFAVPAEISMDYYYLTPDATELIATTASTTVAAMQGVFVNNSNGASSVIFMEAETGTNNAGESKLALNLTRNRSAAIDRAIVRFDEGQQLPKFQLNPESTKLYIAQGNKDYAIVRSAAQGEMPVSFRAAENGTYTLSIETENVEMDYLHLIDNMTGMDIDLLQTPSYSFEAKTSDYASRFRLVFSANGIDEQNAETFAFFNGSEWMVSNLGEATLQVVDVMGRVLSTETISGNAELSLNQPAGVYMLRLINGNDVKVQKVIVK